MKNALYILLLIVEAFIALIFMGQTYSTCGPIFTLIVAVVFAALLAMLIVRYFKQKAANDEAGKKKTRRHIALAMLLPTAVSLCVVIYTVVSLFLYFG